MDELIASFRPDLFKGKRVIVSGGTRGIGLGIAEGFARLGAEIDVLGRSAGGAMSKEKGISFHAVDARDRKALAAFITGQPRLDILVNCAGIARPRDEYRDDVYLEVMDVNLNAAMWDLDGRPAAADQDRRNGKYELTNLGFSGGDVRLSLGDPLEAHVPPLPVPQWLSL